jgi:gluconolactonase
MILLAACSTNKTEQAAAPPPGVGSIERLDPGLDALVPASARIEKIGSGYGFTEGPI